jgi:fimbrial isopeptide formation D2 family protein/LPXTG-motif cell wall-anchored protein
MKIMKRLGAVVMTIAMILSFSSIPAFADTATATATVPTGSLTIQDTTGAQKTTSDYSAYQIVTFDVSKLNGNTVYTNMKLNSIYKTAIIGAISGLTASSSDYDILTAVSKLDATQMASLAITLKGIATSTTATYTTGNGKIAGMTYGYYLVIETANRANDGTVLSKPILVSIPSTDTTPCAPNVFITVKTSKAGIEKKIVETDSSNNKILVDSSTAAVGDRVDYQSLSSIPTYSADSTNLTYFVTDTMSAGLTFGAIDAVKIVNASGTTQATLGSTDYKMETSGINGATFRITLNNSNNIKAWGNATYSVLVTYHATVNSGATYGNIGNPNSINLTYSNSPDNYTTPNDTVITYTNKLIITKKDSKDSGVKLGGAIFDLYRDNTKIDEVTTLDDGTASFGKMEQGSYKLVETKAPDGYSLLTNPIEFTVGANNGSYAIPDKRINVAQIGNIEALKFTATWLSSNANVVVGTDGTMSLDVSDDKGFTLPGTGGIGTTIFTAAGILIILLGGFMLLMYTKKKKHSAQH